MLAGGGGGGLGCVLVSQGTVVSWVTSVVIVTVDSVSEQGVVSGGG